jgi:hypothetical protein
MSFTSILDRFSSPKPTPRPGPATSNTDITSLTNAMNDIYQTQPTNWYTAKPYGFKMTLRTGDIFTCFLPINPSNIQVVTNFGTNVVKTLYGTVEEHSDVRYFDITISGTTGFVPKYASPGAGQPSSAEQVVRSTGRPSFSVATGVALSGLFSKTLGTVNNILNKATDLVSGAPKNETGVYTDQSGYIAFHNLYRFLLRYKKDASGADGNIDERTTHPLTFFNYKDNIQYDVAIKNFVLTRDANNPLLYNYQISMTGYNLQKVGGSSSENITQTLSDLGLNGVDGSSLLGDIKEASNNAKAIIGSAVGGISILGR